MCYTYYSAMLKKIKEFINKYLIWIILILCLFLFLYIIKLINADSISTFDNYIYSYEFAFIYRSLHNIHYRNL